MLMEARRTVIAEATQTADQLVPNFDVRAVEVSQPTPDAIGPLECREGRSRETLEHRLVCVLPQDDRPKEVNVLGLFGDEEEIDRSIRHGNGHPSSRYSAERKRQNRYQTSLRATGVCPCHPWSESRSALECCIVAVQLGVVELDGLVESQTESQSEVSLKLNRTIRLEQGREELHAVAESCLIVACVLGNAFISLAGHIKPLEQVLDCVRQHPRIGPCRGRPRRLVEYEPGVHGLRRRRETRAARSTCA